MYMEHRTYITGIDKNGKLVAEPLVGYCPPNEVATEKRRKEAAGWTSVSSTLAPTWAAAIKNEKRKRGLEVAQ